MQLFIILSMFYFELPNYWFRNLRVRVQSPPTPSESSSYDANVQLRSATSNKQEGPKSPVLKHIDRIHTIVILGGLKIQLRQITRSLQRLLLRNLAPTWLKKHGRVSFSTRQHRQGGGNARAWSFILISTIVAFGKHDRASCWAHGTPLEASFFAYFHRFLIFPLFTYMLQIYLKANEFCIINTTIRLKSKTYFMLFWRASITY